MTSTSAQSQSDPSADPEPSSGTTHASDGSSSEGGSSERGWVLVWSDEFEGDAIDPARWQHEVNCWGGGNGEQQCYTDDPDNAFVDGGQLHIVARGEPTSGPAVNDDDPAYDPGDTSVTLPYSSARLRTRGMGDWRFARVEVRARLPRGQGTWTGVWMLPTELVYGGWAASGEIDIMEAVNLGVDGEARVYGTLHYGSYWPANVHTGAEYSLPGGASPADEFHDYALEWERGEIRWYVDDVHYATQREDGWYTQYDDGSGKLAIGEGAAPFDETFHLILNLAVGGAWAGNVNAGGIDAAVFPQELTIEHVRVFECSLDPESGSGCATIGDDYQLVPGIDPPP
jgi:beta-glucanase (GH16 family)